MPFITSAERLGREEGLREMCLESIELMLRGKFGDEGAQLLPEIRQIEDLELLRTIHRAIMPAASLEEVRRLWP